MNAVAQIPRELETFLDEVVGVLAEFDVQAAYLVGSGSFGAYAPGRSDVDVYAVVPRPLTDPDKDRLRAQLAALEPPARRLELVVYSRMEAETPQPRFELNFGDEDESPHWFVIDRAVAERHAVALVGPEWSEIFAPVPQDRILEALAQSLEWYERHDPTGVPVVAARAWAWLETGEWMGKEEAAGWLSAHVREHIEEERR
jgi:predicted nucleotidyltransferase